MDMYCYGPAGSHKKVEMDEIGSGKWRCPECPIVIETSQ